MKQKGTRNKPNPAGAEAKPAEGGPAGEGMASMRQVGVRTPEDNIKHDLPHATVGAPRKAANSLDPAISNPSMSPGNGLRLIIVYKFVKAAAGLLLALVLVGMLVTGTSESLVHFGTAVRRHFAGAWAAPFANALGMATTTSRLWLVAGAVAVDGVLTSVEGYALYRKWWWGPWLVVAATSMLLPFEIRALVRQPHLGRAVLFGLNALIVVYFVRHARRLPRRVADAGGPLEEASAQHERGRSRSAPTSTPSERG